MKWCQILICRDWIPYFFILKLVFVLQCIFVDIFTLTTYLILHLQRFMVTALRFLRISKWNRPTFLDLNKIHFCQKCYIVLMKMWYREHDRRWKSLKFSETREFRSSVPYLVWSFLCQLELKISELSDCWKVSLTVFFKSCKNKCLWNNTHNCLRVSYARERDSYFILNVYTSLQLFSCHFQEN